MGQNPPPVEFLISTSNTSLEAFELARLNKAANLRKEFRQVLEEWVESEVESRIARWILECRRAENAGDFSDIAGRMEPVRGHQLALLFGSRSTGPLQSIAVENSVDGRSQRELASPLSANRDPASPAGKEEIALLPFPKSQNHLDSERVNHRPSLPSPEIPESYEDATFRALLDLEGNKILPGTRGRDAARSSRLVGTKVSLSRRNNRRHRHLGLKKYCQATENTRLDADFDRPREEARPAPALHARSSAQPVFACGIAVVTAC